MKRTTAHLLPLITCLLLLLAGMIGCDSSDTDKLPVNDDPELVFVNDDEPQRISMNSAQLKRVVPPVHDAVYSGTIYEYNSEGQLSRVSQCLYNNEEVTDTVEYKIHQYDQEGRLNLISSFNANKNAPTGFINLQTEVYIYSDNGNLQKKITHYPVISQSEQTLYKYKNNMLYKQENYSSTGILDNYITYSYDKVGKLILECNYTANNQLIRYTQHSFTNGLNTRSVTFLPTGEAERKVINTFDSNYNLIRSESKELVSYSSRMDFTAQYEYD